MIHAFKNSGYNIILDENSGAVHVVDEAAFETACVLSKKAEDESSFHMEKDIPKDILVAVSANDRDLSEEEIKEAYSELFSLYEEKALFAEDTYKGAVDSFTHHPTVVRANTTGREASWILRPGKRPSTLYAKTRGQGRILRSTSSAASLS